MNTHEALKLFCGDPDRMMDVPFASDGNIYATDGKSVIRTDRHAVHFHDLPNLFEKFPRYLDPGWAYAPKCPESLQTNKTGCPFCEYTGFIGEECEVCLGAGNVECQLCNHKQKCKECEGTGLINRSICQQCKGKTRIHWPYLQVGNATLGDATLFKLLQLPNLQFYVNPNPDTLPMTPVPFRSQDFDGFARPCKEDNPPKTDGMQWWKP